MTSKLPLVSAITIFYNAEKFIGEAIASVAGQVFEDWELLLVDDGSTDRSSEIARDWAARWPGKIRYFEQPGRRNRGMSAARNLGIRHARGRYIAFLDADDVWLPDKLERQIASLEKFPQAAMSVAPIQWWYSWTGKFKDSKRDFVAPFPPGIPSDSLIEPPDLLIALLRRATVSTTSSMLRREAIERVGGFEESFRGMFEDQAFAAKIYLSAPVFVAGDCHYRWRKHGESCCAVAVQSAHYEEARFEFLSWLKGYLAKRKIQHAELGSVIEEELHKASMNQQCRALGSLYTDQGSLVAITKGVVRRLVPLTIRQRVYNWRKDAADPPPIGRVNLGQMRRLTPISRAWGFDRGTPVDRYYIERFLSAHADDVRGSVLEIGDDSYTRKFGGARVVQSDVLYPVKGNPRATLVADLTRAETIASDQFDCIICTQTLMFIFDIHQAMRSIYRILRPGGVLLLTVAGVSHQISREDMERWGDYWRFTSLSARRLCELVFPPENVSVNAHGNVLTAVAFLHGLAREELYAEELDTQDPDYEVLIAARAVKPATTA